MQLRPLETWRSTVATLLSVLLMATACGGSGESGGPIILVSRQLDQLFTEQGGGDDCLSDVGRHEFFCGFPESEFTLRSAEHDGAVWYRPDSGIGFRSGEELTAACAGREFGRVSMTQLVRKSTTPGRLLFDDGSEATMTIIDFIDVRSFDGGSPSLCRESSGRWQGSGGRLLGRSGTFTNVWDGIQSVVTLIDD